MRMKLIARDTDQKISPNDVLDYAAFRNRFQKQVHGNELEVFERFHAARLLIGEGFEAYVGAQLTGGDDTAILETDACGVEGNRMTAVFCETGEPKESTWKALRLINTSQNVEAVILSQHGIDIKAVQRTIPGGLESGKVRLEILGWFDDTLEEPLQRTLRIIELMLNETRMKMLTPLLEKSGVKKEYRAKINPKLVYHNLSTLTEAGIVDEPQAGTYELSQFGKTVLAEFITFLEKTRRTLDAYEAKEVKLNGR